MIRSRARRLAMVIAWVCCYAVPASAGVIAGREQDDSGAQMPFVGTTYAVSWSTPVGYTNVAISLFRVYNPDPDMALLLALMSLPAGEWPANPQLSIMTAEAQTEIPVLQDLTAIDDHDENNPVADLGPWSPGINLAANRLYFLIVSACEYSSTEGSPASNCGAAYNGGGLWLTGSGTHTTGTLGPGYFSVDGENLIDAGFSGGFQVRADVPEPSSAVLAGLGLLVAGVVRRFRSRPN